jgi:hypothetical protein
VAAEVRTQARKHGLVTGADTRSPWGGGGVAVWCFGEDKIG